MQGVGRCVEALVALVGVSCGLDMWLKTLAMWSWFSGTVPKVPQAPQAPKPERCSAALWFGRLQWQQYQLPPKMLCARAPRWPCPEVPSSYFREACYKQLPSPGQWICSCSLANMLEEDFCRGCGGKSPARCEKDLAARAREEERLRLEEVARQERAQCGQLTAADLKFAHLEGRKMMPELRGYEARVGINWIIFFFWENYVWLFLGIYCIYSIHVLRI
ncbi:unnamed protein product [Cladocopium goreaui]|uniref:RanBP2-type domain-containing protein n=1 Tax=Cladocopium goreaui TaxID=2562237 RepID=A0A9P1FIM6_9DINO|nr:unnamed protein product [Cladocopium goreaui]